MLNQRALSLMSEQYGVITRPQLLGCGLTPGQVEGLVARGALRPAECGTYRLPGGAVPAEQAAMAAVLRCRPVARLTGPFVLGLAAVLRCRPVARLTGPFVLGLLGIEGFGLGDPFEVLVPPRRRVQNVPFRVRTDPLPGEFVAAVGPLPIVTATRALVDTARTVSGKRLIVGVDSARWRGLTRVDRLLRLAERLPRDRGARLMRELIASGALDHESQGERAIGVLFADYDPPPEPQVWITPRIRVDFVWQDVRLILEFDGERHHRLAFDRDDDRRRDRELAALGYVVEHITSADLASPLLLRQRVIAMRRALATRQGASGCGADYLRPRSNAAPQPCTTAREARVSSGYGGKLHLTTGPPAMGAGHGWPSIGGMEVIGLEDVEAVRGRVVEVLRRGELAVVPTDTVYGMVGDAFDGQATQRIFGAKRQGRDVPLGVVIRSPRQVNGLVAEVPEAAERLMASYWPGPLTLVFLQSEGLHWDLGDSRGAIGLRLPTEDLLVAVTGEVGPLVCTAARRRGGLRPTTVEVAQAQLGDRVSLYVDGGSREGMTSTIVDVTRGRAEVLRQGAIPARAIELVATGEVGWGQQPAVEDQADLGQAEHERTDQTDQGA